MQPINRTDVHERYDSNNMTFSQAQQPEYTNLSELYKFQQSGFVEELADSSRKASGISESNVSQNNLDECGTVNKIQSLQNNNVA